MDGIRIALKRALNYQNKETKEILPGVGDRILDYGEPLYLKECGYIIIGDGVSTVEELIKKFAFFFDAGHIVLPDGDIYHNGSVLATIQDIIDAINALDADKKELQPNQTLSFLEEVDGKINFDVQNIKIGLNDLLGDIGPSGDIPSAPKNTGEAGTKTKWARADHVHPRESKTNKTDGIIYVTGVLENSPELFYCKNPNGSQEKNGVRIDCKSGILYGAAWNDFAEYRRCEGGRAGSVVCEVGDGSLRPSYERLQAGASVISDTYGMAVGEQTNDAQPIAVAGRVLVNYIGEASKYKPGDAVCAAQFGRIDKMTRDEIREFPDRILGYVSEIPTYTTWHGVSVDGRLWIKIK